MEFREQVPLAPYTTFEIGGPARWFVDVASEDELIAAVGFARERSLPLLVLGGGSNLLIGDDGFPGLVVHMAIAGVDKTASPREGTCRFSVGAGEDWDGFVSQVVSEGYGGVECMAGIPGTVGGTPIQNVGAYGQEVSNTIVAVRALDLSTIRYADLPAEECGFGYRVSIFNSSARGRYVVARVVFELTNLVNATISYKDIKQYFENKTQDPTLVEVSDAVREIRKNKGMLLVPGDADCRSAGSFFKNPVVATADLGAVAEATGVGLHEVPSFSAGDRSVKVPAAWLLERAGFHKGHRAGRAGISSRHTLALVNLGGASAGDVLALRDEIVEKVKTKFGIELATEPVVV